MRNHPPSRPSRRRFLSRASACAAAGFAGAFGAAESRAQERKRIVDPETGVEIWQITSFPTVNQNLYFHSRCWTADGKTFLFKSLRENRRDSAHDLYKANIDGLGMERLTTRQAFSDFALHPTRRIGYFVDAGAVHSLDIDSKKIERLAAPGRGSVGGGIGSMTDDGRLYCFDWRDDAGAAGFGLFDTESGKVETIALGVKGKFTHLQLEPREGKLVQYVSDTPGGKIGVYVGGRDGKSELLPFVDANGHNAWLGATGKVYTDTLGERRDILVASPGDRESGVLAKSPPRFWHTGASPEGDWMVSDTLSPDDGLFLICVKTGKSARLCRAGSSQGQSQYTHPHPSVSPGGRHVLFNSDRTGIPHVYCAEIPERMKRELE